MTTGWPAVRDTCGNLGIRFDTWQDGAGRAILGKGTDGLYAADAVVLSIPRQVGKTFLIGWIVFALCVIFPGLTVLWTAHRYKTATETFNSLRAMARRQRVRPHIAKVTQGAGDQVIYFANGSRILFGARERGFGRGFTDVDVEVFDEAQILTEAAIDDMIPATNVAPNPLILYMGTPPKPTDPGEVFSRHRAEALSGESSDELYIELSADRDAHPLDREQWSKANPSYPTRTTARAMLRMRKNLTPDAFLREGLGIWDEVDSSRAFGPGRWEACGPSEDQPNGSDGLRPAALGVAAAVDGSHSCIVAAARDGERFVVKVLRYGEGLEWVLAEAGSLSRDLLVPAVVDSRGPAAQFIQPLKDSGVEVEAFSTNDVLDGCAQVHQLVQERRVGHPDDEHLNGAVRAAIQRPVGDRWAWGRRQSAADISPLEAMTLAVAHAYRGDGGILF